MLISRREFLKTSACGILAAILVKISDFGIVTKKAKMDKERAGISNLKRALHYKRL